MIRLRRLRCSFCRKNQAEVSKLVAGPRVYICDECVAIATRMMENGPHDNHPPAKVGNSAWRKLTGIVRHLLHRGDAQRVSYASASR